MPRGPITASIAVIGDGPGPMEIKTGMAFTGPSGKFTDEALVDLDIDPAQVYFDNVFRIPGEKENLDDLMKRGKEAINRLKNMPNLSAVIAFGEVAARGLLGIEGDVVIGEERKEKHMIGDTPVIVTYHPSALLRTGRTDSKFYDDWRSDLDRAIAISEKTMASKQRGGKFVLLRRWWRVVQVVREGPVKQFWHLKWDLGERWNQEILLEGDPLKSDKLIGKYNSRDPKANFDMVGTFTAEEAGEPGPKERGTITIEKEDEGRITELSSTKERKEFEIAGNELQGRWALIDQGGGVYSFERITEKRTLDGVEYNKFVPFIHHEKKAGDDGEFEHLVYGVVYEPHELDSDRDWSGPKNIKRMAHNWLISSRNYRVMHKINTDKIKVAESYIAPTDFYLNHQLVRKGSWVLVSKIVDKGIWDMILSGKLTGYSLGGRSVVREGVAPPSHLSN